MISCPPTVQFPYERFAARGFGRECNSFWGGTESKSSGSVPFASDAAPGGFVTGRKSTLDYLRYYSHPYGFSCALPPSVVGGLLKALDIATTDDTPRRTLWDNTKYFREQLLGLGLNLGDSTTHVVPIVIGSDRRMLYELCHEMTRKGLFLAPVDYPSVPEDELRFRAAITAAHSRQDLDEALQIIEDTIVRRTK